jgi:ABC-type sugar transport system permease subunit
MGYCLWVGTGYNILIMGGAMANLPEEVMEYSRLEGVGYFHELFKVVIPMIWPTISVGILTSVTTMFTLFIQVELLTENGGTFHQSTTIGFMINSIVKGGTDLEWASTLGICFTVVAIPIIIGVRKATEKISENFGF